MGYNSEWRELAQIISRVSSVGSHYSILRI